MSEILFANPLGDPFQASSQQDIVHLLQSKGEDYWNARSGPGHTSLYYYPIERTSDVPPAAYLDFTSKDDVGFHIYYVRATGDGTKLKRFASGDTSDYSKVVRVRYAGGWRRVPTALFISRHDAIEVIRRFFEDGGQTDRVRWVKSSDIPWNQIE